MSITITKYNGADVVSALHSHLDGDTDVESSVYDTTKGATVSSELVNSALNGETVHGVIALGARPETNESYKLDAGGIPVGLSAEIQVDIDGLDYVSVLTGPGNIGDSGFTNRDAKRFAEDWECLHRKEIAEKLRNAKLLDIFPSEIADGGYTQIASIKIAEGDWDGLHYAIEGVITAQRVDD